MDYSRNPAGKDFVPVELMSMGDNKQKWGNIRVSGPGDEQGSREVQGDLSTWIGD